MRPAKHTNIGNTEKEYVHVNTEKEYVHESNLIGTRVRTQVERHIIHTPIPVCDNKHEGKVGMHGQVNEYNIPGTYPSYVYYSNYIFDMPRWRLPCEQAFHVFALVATQTVFVVSCRVVYCTVVLCRVLTGPYPRCSPGYYPTKNLYRFRTTFISVPGTSLVLCDIHSYPYPKLQ